MIIQLKNEFLTVEISDRGAELQSVRGEDGTEYLWQGDKTYWGERAPVLFPFCGRFWQDRCTDAGIPCNPGMHGFFRSMTTGVTDRSEQSATFSAHSNEETLAKYPYPFAFHLTYALRERTVTLTAEIVNCGSRTLPYALGFHPGFNLPFAGGAMTDYTVHFMGADGEIQRVKFDAEECFPIGGTRAFALRDGAYFDPTDAFFAAGSGFFCEMPHTVALEKRGSGKSVTLRFSDDFRYFGLWKAPGGGFLCMEPWTSMPAMHGENTELTEKADLRRLGAGEREMLFCEFEFC